MIIVYGIPNCSTVKKARTWLVEHGIAHGFHDLKKQGVSVEQLTAWAQAVGWEKLLNRQGTTWRQLDPIEQHGATNAPHALVLMQRLPSLIKRPVVDWRTGITVGFDPTAWQTLLTQSA